MNVHRRSGTLAGVSALILGLASCAGVSTGFSERANHRHHRTGSGNAELDGPTAYDVIHQTRRDRHRQRYEDARPPRRGGG